MWTYRILTVTILVGSTGWTACRTKEPPAREYMLQGQILAVTADKKEANIKHDDIKGFMPAMTMIYKAREAKEFEGLKTGDLIKATLVVLSNDAYLKSVIKIGEAPIENPPEDKPSSAASGFELLKAGEP